MDYDFYIDLIAADKLKEATEYKNSCIPDYNMPMWAYYANNHSGFCVEYMIDRKVKKFMYPVSYDDTRAPGNSIIGNIIDQTFDLIKEGKGEDELETRKRNKSISTTLLWGLFRHLAKENFYWN